MEGGPLHSEPLLCVVRYRDGKSSSDRLRAPRRRRAGSTPVVRKRFVDEVSRHQVPDPRGASSDRLRSDTLPSVLREYGSSSFPFGTHVLLRYRLHTLSESRLSVLETLTGLVLLRSFRALLVPTVRDGSQLSGSVSELRRPHQAGSPGVSDQE